MPTPVVLATAVTDGTTATGTPAVNLPATVSVGNLLVVWFRTSASGAIGWPADWNEVFDENLDASVNQYALAWKWAHGSEDSTTITLSSTSSKFAALSYAIENAGEPLVGTRAVGTSTTPDPPSFSPAGGAQDFLWLWLGSWEGEQTSPPASNPTNYTNPIGANSGTAGLPTTNVRVASARRALNTATEDAPSWTISGSDDWSAGVLAVPPAPPPPSVIGMAQGLGASY